MADLFYLLETKRKQSPRSVPFQSYYSYYLFRLSPVDTRRCFNVYKTLIRHRRHHIDVLQTLKRRRVSAGLQKVLLYLQARPFFTTKIRLKSVFQKSSNKIQYSLFHDGGCCHIETSLLICRANLWMVFCMIGTSVQKELKEHHL